MSKKPLVHKDYLLQKFKGKGGWTYAEIPEVSPGKNTPFGWVQVKGSIDGYPIEKYKLQPMGNGKLFLPVNAKIRKQIGKEAGDRVEVILFRDETPETVREELLLCLKVEPGALEAFQSLIPFKQNALTDWVYQSKTDTEKVNRIADILKQMQAIHSHSK
ncbi:YdeI/OmpD-associated family protein [Planktosalinus lacus]|uniref:DUF1905 domain-containing protein n=1 Tax=Planktosalinus lacus TaxID=1526573 RepID=A0A8J2VBN0_9FLAO|nr:YdeI/OmpD-associated family protein [Planktosalinus lacus]GGD99929.1 hypothetical protein GCM10011312_24280 [Planktosalinus lacus]